VRARQRQGHEGNGTVGRFGYGGVVKAVQAKPERVGFNYHPIRTRRDDII